MCSSVVLLKKHRKICWKGREDVLIYTGKSCEHSNSDPNPIEVELVDFLKTNSCKTVCVFVPFKGEVV